MALSHVLPFLFWKSVLIYSKTTDITTKRNKQIVDITADVGRVVTESDIGDGFVLIFTLHTTSGLFINEHESGLLQDVEGVLCGLVPETGAYRHDRVDDNATSHIQSILVSTSLAVPVESGRLVLGTWQSIFLAERDGPRKRSIVLRVVGDMP